MIQKRVEQIIQEIADKHNKPYHVVEEIYLSQFRLVAETMKGLTFETIKLPSFGKFLTSRKKVVDFKRYLLYKYEHYEGRKANRDSEDTSLQG